MTARSDVPREDSWIDLVLHVDGLLEQSSERSYSGLLFVCVLSSFERTGGPVLLGAEPRREVKSKRRA